MIAMRPLGVLSSWTAGGALEGSGWGWLPGWHGALFPHATGYGLSAGPLSRPSLCVSCGITLQRVGSCNQVGCFAGLRAGWGGCACTVTSGLVRCCGQLVLVDACHCFDSKLLSLQCCAWSWYVCWPVLLCLWPPTLWPGPQCRLPLWYACCRSCSWPIFRPASLTGRAMRTTACPGDGVWFPLLTLVVPCMGWRVLT